MIDLHAHLLPGVDDGAETIEESRAIARASAADGVDAISATPHVRYDHPTSVEVMERGVAELRQDFEREGIPVQVLHGGELDLEMLRSLEPDVLRRFTLAQSGTYLLVEFPYTAWPLGLDRQLFELVAGGITPLLAHPERNRDVQENPERIAELTRVGAAVQVTAASLEGRLGKSSRVASLRLLELGLVDVLASDLHGFAVREARLSAAAETLKDGGLARHLTVDAPRAIVAGEELPERPVLHRRRRLFRP